MVQAARILVAFSYQALPAALNLPLEQFLKVLGIVNIAHGLSFIPSIEQEFGKPVT